MNSRAFRRRIGMAVTVLTSIATPLQPQAARQLRVRVIAAGDAVPIRGSLVSILDERGARIANQLTDKNGLALLAVAGDKPFLVRAERAGFETYESDLISPPAPDSLNVVLTRSALRLGTVAVRGRTRCEVQPEGTTTAALWIEIQKSLRALSASAAVTSTVAPTVTNIARYTRQLDRRLRVERGSSTEFARTRSTKPFHTAPAESLMTSGFIRDSGGTRLYYAPDADVIMSDWFANDHCFRLAKRNGGGQSLIGLAFEPVPTRTVSEVRGVLWVDPRTTSLHSLEFEYTRLPEDVDGARATGQMEFAQLEDGRWIVRRWYVRAPRFGRVVQRNVGTLQLPTKLELIGFSEEGGIVSSPGLPIDSFAPSSRSPVIVPGTARDSLQAPSLTALPMPSLSTFRAQCAPSAPRQPGIVYGLVVDSATERPLPNATLRAKWTLIQVRQTGKVVAGGTTAITVDVTTDSAGAFLLCDVPLERQLVFELSGQRVGRAELRLERDNPLGRILITAR